MKKKNKSLYFAPALFLAFCISIAFSQNLGRNAISYNKEGWEYSAKGDYFRAILAFKNALKQNPKYKEALLGLGKAYIKTEAFEESMKLLGDVLKLDKNNTDAINGIASAMTALGRYNNALKYFDMSLKLKEDNIDARYGISYIYFLMDKTIWAKRTLYNILSVNPFQYDSLLLMADIKTREKRNNEALSYIQKAIDSESDLPDAYVKYGQVMLKNFKESQNTDFLAEAEEKFSKALAIHPENLSAARSMGNLFLMQKDYENALKYFEKTAADYPGNAISLYDIAITYAGMNNTSKAVEYFLKALKVSPSDSVLRSRFEDFLILNDFAEGNPLRVKFSDEHNKTAVNKLKINLPGDVILHLKRSLLLNPLNLASREMIRNIYQTLNYNELYINEIKTLYSMYQESKYQDMLKIAIIKRRDRVYHKAGYSTELPPRDVPKVLVLNFMSIDPVSLHPDAGETIANYLTFTLSQFGRMEPVGVKKRLEICTKLKDERKYLGDNLEILGDMVKQEEIEKPDFIVFGDYREGLNNLAIDYELLDFSTGVITNNFSVLETGKDNLPNLAIRASKRLYDSIPFKGKVLSVNDNEIIVNLGLIDGVKPGDFIVINKIDSFTDKDAIKTKKKLMFQVDDADTMIASAKPKLTGDMELIDINDAVYPFKRQRAKLIK